MIYGTATAYSVVDRLTSMRDVLEIQKTITKAARTSLERQGFLEIIPPLLTRSTDPGLRGAKILEVELYGKKCKLTSSMMTHKISAASAIGRVFALSPCLREEKPEAAKTGRHLAEFWQIDVELQGKKEEAMAIAETMLRDVMKEVVETKEDELCRLGRTLVVPELPLKRLKHSEAVELARELGYEADEKGEVPWEAEKAISRYFGGPFFIVDYPKDSRCFYDKTVSDTQIGFDLIYPEGFGEALSGSERELEPKEIERKLLSIGEKVDEYRWFIDLVREGKIKQTAGFGFGVERLTRYVCGLPHIEQATPFPRVPGGEAI